MSTFWQMLRVAFWMLPAQRVLTVIASVLLLWGLVFHLGFNPPRSSLPPGLIGVTLLLIVPLLAGGIFLRMLSASRSLLLRPHARGRMLLSAAAIVLLSALLLDLVYWFAALPAPSRFRPDFEQYALLFVMTLSLGTQCLISLFIASRSPSWTLIIILAWQAPGLLLHALGVEDASRLLGGPVSLGASLIAWTAFSIWFLKARRIHASQWRRQDDGKVSTALTLPPTTTREQAMSRWILANHTPLRIGLQCLLAAAAVLLIQWVLAREIDTAVLQATMFGTIAAIGLVSGAVSWSMVARSRTLWLAGARNRVELHRWFERQVLSVWVCVAAAVLIAAGATWLFIVPSPALPPVYLACAVLAPGLCAAWWGLMQQHARSALDVVAVLLIVLGIFYGVLGPLFTRSAEARWDILSALLALALWLRTVAWMRWRGADWRRAQRT
jgi:hypothetical protein